MLKQQDELLLSPYLGLYDIVVPQIRLLEEGYQFYVGIQFMNVNFGV